MLGNLFYCAGLPVGGTGARAGHRGSGCGAGSLAARKARGDSHFPHIIASGRRFICMRAADQDPLQPLSCYLINRHESYGALVFLNYMKKCQQRKNSNIQDTEQRELVIGRVIVSGIFLLFGVVALQVVIELAEIWTSLFRVTQNQNNGGRYWNVSDRS